MAAGDAYESDEMALSFLNLPGMGTGTSWRKSACAIPDFNLDMTGHVCCHEEVVKTISYSCDAGAMDFCGLYTRGWSRTKKMYMQYNRLRITCIYI